MLEVVKRQGFTLVEIAVVISIIGLLAAVVTVNVGEVKEEARIKTTQAQVEQLKLGLQLYFYTFENYPPEPGYVMSNEVESEYGDLWTGKRTDGVITTTKIWEDDVIPLLEPYIAGIQDLKKDPWGHFFYYDDNYGPGVGCGPVTVLCSVGPNGVLDSRTVNAVAGIPADDDICAFLPHENPDGDVCTD